MKNFAENPKVSLIITAWKEQTTIARCIRTLVEGYQGDYELILACPDQETMQAAQDEVDKLGIADRFVYIQDPGRGKPVALNMILDQAQGDILFLGDGDTYFGPNVVEHVLKHFEDPNVGAVTGRPMSADSKGSMMGYFGNLLADAAHHKRNLDLAAGTSKLVSKRNFFPVSGYLYAMRKSAERFPEDVLADDAYISYVIHNAGLRIAYEPAAIVYVKYPTTLSDYFKQKKRSVGGYIQLWKYGIVTKQTTTRSFWRELEYFWFPLAYARGLRQLFWSLLLYPIRFYLWLIIWWERKVLHKDFGKTWVRIESTK